MTTLSQMQLGLLPRVSSAYQACPWPDAQSSMLLSCNSSHQCPRLVEISFFSSSTRRSSSSRSPVVISDRDCGLKGRWHPRACSPVRLPLVPASSVRQLEQSFATHSYSSHSLDYPRDKGGSQDGQEDDDYINGADSVFLPGARVGNDVNGGSSQTCAAMLGLGLGMASCSMLFPEASSAAAAAMDTGSGFGTVMTFAGPEPSNALSLPTWIIHVASVVEWVTAMVLVWKYGDTKGNSAWKGLAWGMVPLLGGAMCACTWHFFYNAESLEVLVVLQAFLTVVGNFTMWAASYRIWKSSQGKVVN